MVPLPPNERSLNVQGVVPYNAAYLQIQWAYLLLLLGTVGSFTTQT